MISLAIHTENVLALETKEVGIEISFVANLTHGSLSLANGLSLSVNEVFVKVVEQKFVFLVLPLLFFNLFLRVGGTNERLDTSLLDDILKIDRVVFVCSVI